jgi:hypothetical protein
MGSHETTIVLCALSTFTTMPDAEYRCEAQQEQAVKSIARKYRRFIDLVPVALRMRIAV